VEAGTGGSDLMLQTWVKIDTGLAWTRPPYADIPISARDNLGEPGTYKPNASNTGVTPGTVLTVHEGDFTTSKPYQVVENLDITGRVNVRHSFVTIRNCNVRNSFPPSDTNGGGNLDIWGAINTRAVQGVVGCTVQDCTLTAANPNVNCYGVVGREVTIRRCDISKVVDAMAVQENNCHAYANYVHDMRWYAYDPRQSNGSHSDGLQWAGGNLLRIVGNYFELAPVKGTSGTGLFTGSWHGNDIVVDRNWYISTATAATQVDAFSMGLNIADKGNGYLTNITLTNNRFSPNGTWKFNVPIQIQDSTYQSIVNTPRLAGNVYDDTGLPARITHPVDA
jgi:hypothetical protein